MKHGLVRRRYRKKGLEIQEWVQMKVHIKTIKQIRKIKKVMTVHFILMYLIEEGSMKVHLENLPEKQDHQAVLWEVAAFLAWTLGLI